MKITLNDQITKMRKMMGILDEVRYINTRWNQQLKEPPLKDNEVIRVYHGFSGGSGFNQALQTLVYGLSGKERARRIYSYESGNNPKGLFVSVDFNTVKKNFASSGVIIEFSTKLSDLEAPVWAGGGSYFVQGQLTKSFSNDQEREQQRLANREREKSNPATQISKSDRPELAQTLFDNAERQALFIGDLNPNMIKYVWYNQTLDQDRRTNGEWVRYTRTEFIDKFKHRIESSRQSLENQYGDYKSNRMFKPNEDFNEKEFMDKLNTKYGDGTYENWIEIELAYEFDEYNLRNYFWPKQMQQAKEFYKQKFPELKITDNK